jgi:hypothetical protein
MTILFSRKEPPRAGGRKEEGYRQPPTNGELTHDRILPSTPIQLRRVLTLFLLVEAFRQEETLTINRRIFAVITIS